MKTTPAILALNLFSGVLALLPLCPAAAEESATAAEGKAPLLSAATNHQIALRHEAFGKDFLLSASVIPQLVAATGSSLAGKIVRFEVFEDGVDLYESTQGLLVTRELPARRLLTTFPIVAKNDNGIVIDFNAGMKRVFNDIWYGSSEKANPVRGRNPLLQARSLEIPQSRIFEVRPEGDQLVIRQSALIRDRQNDPNMEERVEVRYFIGPRKDADFQSREHTPDVSRHVRFFETYPQLEDTSGRTSTRAALYDIRKPVVIHYSANTPAEYESAVRDGILYWNRAFGRDVVSAEKAPEGVTAPDSRFSLVQWVPWDMAGFAYADVIVDPLSGATQRGQAFLTSTFSFQGKARARALLRAMRNLSPGPSQDGSPKKVESDFLWQRSTRFEGLNACQGDSAVFVQQFANDLESALSDRRFDDASAKRVSGDYVREIVAHEVGHMLGLRHNFSGSVSANLSHKELLEWFTSYLSDDDTKLLADRIPSSSVMDYLDLKSSVKIGWMIRKTKEVLPYDRAAVQWGYLGSKEVAEKKMLFGTDQDVSAYGDVVPYDYGRDPMIGAYAAIGEALKSLPNSLIEEFIAAKAPRNAVDKKPLEQVSPDPERAAAQVADLYGKLLAWFKAGSRSLRIEREFSFVGPLNRKEILRAHWKSLNEQIDRLGGVDRALFAYFPVEWKLELKGDPQGVETVEKIDAGKLSDRLAKLLESQDYTDFVGLDEKPANFSKEEKELIQKRGRAFFEEFQRNVLKNLCQKLEKAQRDLGVLALESVGEEDVVSRLEKRILELSKEVVLAKNEEVRHRGKVDKAHVEVVDFRYDLETRMTAARMLSESVGSFRGWSAEPKAELGKLLKEAVDAALNLQNFREFKEAQLSRTLRDWYLNQQSVLNILGSKGAPPSPPPGLLPPPTSPKSSSQP